MKKLIEKRNDLITRAEEILNTAKLEERELTDEEVKELETKKSEVERIDETLKFDEEIRSIQPLEKKDDDEPKKEVRMEEQVRMIDDVQVRESDYKAMDDFIRRSVRSGEMELANNGAVVPTTIADWVVKKVYDVCPILEKSTKINVRGNVDVPFYPANANTVITVAYQTEFTAVTSSTGNFDSITLGGYLAGALCKVSRSLINNAKFDVVAFVVEEMANAIARFIEGELLNGTSGKVDGLSTLSNKVVATDDASVTADELIALQDAVKDVFQNNAIWIMSPATRTAIRQLKGQDGHYLLQDDITSPFGHMLLGKPVFVSDNMPDMEASANAIYYGDMAGLTTKFGEDINIQVLREKFADLHADGVIGWFEFDAKVTNEQMIAKLVMAAS